MELQVIIRMKDAVYDIIEDGIPEIGKQVEKCLAREIGRQMLAETEITINAVRGQRAANENNENN